MLIPETEIIATMDGVEILRKTVRPGEYVIGCEPECEVPIEVELVSRRHAQLTVNYDHALIEDLGSSNGTFVNGQPVTGSIRLWPNQKIQIGAATIELHRVKTVPPPDVSLAPAQAAVQRLLPEEFLRDKKYDIGPIVAQGGMGAILDAKDATTERRVAMKVMLDGSSPDDLTRFVAEAKVTAQLEHPSIVPVYELSVDENRQVFYTMKMVRGITLRKVLELLAAGTAETVKKYPLPVLLTIFQKVCDALAFAHSKGVIHRDLKPENIMLDDFGVVLVMDWGLAKGMKPEGRMTKDESTVAGACEESLRHSSFDISHSAAAATLAGTIMGTPQYMSPEQARGEVEDLDVRSDIYALGAILYHLLALRPPVTGRTAMEIVSKVAQGHVELLVPGPVGRRSSPPGGQDGRLAHLPTAAISNRRLGPTTTIPDSLAAVVRKAMAFERDQRYGTVEELQRDLTAYQNGFATSAENAGAWKQLTLLVKRHKGIVGTAAAAWVIITALAVWFVIDVTAARNRAVRGEQMASAERDRANAERDHASAERDRATANEQRANDTLGRLRGTAPTFFAQAQALIEKQQFADALEKIDYAIDLNPAEAEYHYLKGNLLEDLSRLAEARDAYTEALRLNPAHAFARENLNLCTALLREEEDRAELSKASVNKLNQLMRQEGRAAEAIATVRVLSKDRQALYDTWKTAFAKAGWPLGPDHLILYDDGRFDVHLDNLKIDDISFLHGMSIGYLGLQNTSVSNLRPLEGAPLGSLQIARTAITDLSPLSGMKLNHLWLDETKVTDLSPLQGMPLDKLSLKDAKGVTDLSALRGMPIKVLDLSGTGVTDIRALQGMPLSSLHLNGEIPDYSPLRGMQLTDFWVLSRFRDSDLALLKGMPIEMLRVRDSLVSDLRPLQGMPLKELDLPASKRVTDLSPLAGMKLTRIDVRSTAVTDLSPLRDQPIEAALLDAIPATDFSVVATWPLSREFGAAKTKFNDLRLLAGKHFTGLELQNTSVSDISVLRGMRIRSLRLWGTKVTDLHPIADLPDLEELTIPAEATDIEFLRHLPNLQKLDNHPLWSGGTPRPAADFWKEYDAKKAAEKQ